MKILPSKHFWSVKQEVFSKLNSYKWKYYTHKLLIKHLKHNPNLSVIEIGCVPGRNLIYFARNFGYQVAGIDFTDKTKDVGDTLRLHGIEHFDVICEDFLCFKSANKYDVVFSSGFVEHFTETSEIFQRHIDLLKDNGTLVITLPNFRYGQYILSIFLGGSHRFDWHNLQDMFPNIWRNFAKENGLTVQYCNYYKTFDFWLPQECNILLRLACRSVSKLLNAVLSFLRLDNIPNRLFSPYIVLIAKK